MYRHVFLAQRSLKKPFYLHSISSKAILCPFSKWNRYSSIYKDLYLNKKTYESSLHGYFPTHSLRHYKLGVPVPLIICVL
uniref:Uncharacterized protein n=1 Tax=Anguilla anguilla TaxID=7936 RepID=A0A0E9SYJ8_ANGAN